MFVNLVEEKKWVMKTTIKCYQKSPSEKATATEMFFTLQVPLQLTGDSSAILIGATYIHPFNDGELSHRIEPAL